MNIKHAVVVYKKSSYQKKVLEERSSYYRQLVKKQNISVREWKQLHQEHQACIQHVKQCLQSHNIPFKAYSRFEINGPIKADLIITVGGDGTFLEASHYAKNHVVLGVNSVPWSSVGYFTCCHQDTFENKLKRVLQGAARIKTLQRLQAWSGSKKIGPPALNEILFTSDNAGATSRYWLQKNRGTIEEQKSSGIWIATPAGSTAAIHSAGGKRMPIEAVKFAFRARELYRLPGLKYQLSHGELRAKEALYLTVKMDDAALFIDGSHIMEPVKRGKRLKFQLATQALQVIA